MSDDYLACADLTDGRHLCVMPLIGGRARLVVSDDDRHYTYFDGW